LALLAILVTKPGGVCRDRLLALLWPETDDRHARHQLSDAIYFVRRAFGNEALVTSGPSLQIDPTLIHSDVATFEAAVREKRFLEATAIWTGPFLDGFHAGCGSPFEEWLDGERNRYAGLLADTLEGVAREAEASGDVAEARRWWERLELHDPLSGHAVEGAMRVLTLSGDPALALRRYQAHEARLRDQLDMGPSAQLRDLADRIRRGLF
jgi:DNA-binding SARP family transcriptional activator